MLHCPRITIMRRRFATTHWSVVLAAQEDDSTEARKALAALCEAYWEPLYAFVRRQGYNPDDACDFTQGYFARLLEKKYLSSVHPTKGRFRSFLLVSLRHFLSDERDRERALKRGGEKTIVSMDAEDAETGYRLQPSDHLTPETLFERRWAQTVVTRALDRLRKQYRARGKEALFNELRPLLTGEDEAVPGRQAANTLGISEGAVRVAIHRLRQRFGAALREEVAETVSPSEVDSEIRHLLTVIGGGGGV